MEHPDSDDDLTIPLTPDQDLHLDLTLTATTHNPDADTDADGPVGVVLSVAVDSFRVEMEQGEVSVEGLPEPSMIAPSPDRE